MRWTVCIRFTVSTWPKSGLTVGARIVVQPCVRWGRDLGHCRNFRGLVHGRTSRRTTIHVGVLWYGLFVMDLRSFVRFFPRSNYPSYHYSYRGAVMVRGRTTSRTTIRAGGLRTGSTIRDGLRKFKCNYFFSLCPKTTKKKIDFFVQKMDSVTWGKRSVNYYWDSQVQYS